MPASWPNWGIMALPPGAFITLGLLLAMAEWATEKRASTALWRTVRMLWSWRH
jgi:hypothetical protein